MERAISVDGAAGNDVGGPGERVNGEQGKGRRGGKQLCVRGRYKKTAVVEPIEGLAVQAGDADAELGVAQGRLGEDGVNAIGERAGVRGCWMCGPGRRRLRT